MTLSSRTPSNPCLGLDYLYGAVVQYRRGDSLPPRILPDHELVLIIEGHGTYILEQKEHSISPGSVILARPGFHEAYRWDPKGPTRHAYLHFKLLSIPSDWPKTEEWAIIRRNPDPIVGTLFRHLIERVASHPEWPVVGPSKDDCRVMETLITVFLRPPHPSGVPHSERLSEPVQQALNMMREVLDESPSHSLKLKELAKRAGVTEKHLCRLFTKSMGHPPMDTFRLLKLQLALALLSRSNLPIKEVATRCGFDDPLYFTRCFTRTYGASPTKVREDLLNQKAPPKNHLPPEIMPRVYW